MRRFFLVSVICFLAAALLWATSVGSGAATPAIMASFVNAYNRNNFPLQVVLPPLTDVQALGSPGLVQEFTAKAGNNLKCALVKPDPNAPVSPSDTLQVLSDIYTFYTSVGVSVAGYPTIDTTVCPANGFGTCDYQLFTKDYALFAYSAPYIVNISVADPFYTRWNTGGGISGSFGVATSPQSSVTSISKAAGTQQLFATGVIFSYPASSSTPSVYGIVEPANTAFNTAGGYTSLGFPTSEAFQVNSSGLMQQTFENGRIQWTPGNTPVVIYPVSAVYIIYASQGLYLAAPGTTATITATTTDTTGAAVTGRALTWSTTNGSVATVLGNGYSATITAIGTGTANIYVTVEGKTSVPITVTVGSVCCTVGQGAPTQAISLAFQAAATRDQLSVVLPLASPVTRVGTGYVQNLGSWVVAEADGASTAYVLTGSIYAAYVADGGFAGSLGYPVSDPLPGPAQQFAGGAALAGSPVLVVAAPVAAKWFGLGGVLAGAGAPVAAASAFASYSGVTGVAEAFANGEILAITSGTYSGQAFYSTGLILARYLALSGPSGALGIPISDVYSNGGGVQGVQVENFEGGYIDLQPGASAAVEHYNPRIPALTAAPSVVVPGGKVHVSATGFTPGATLGFTVTSQPAFSVKSATGTFEWDIVVPSSAKAAAVSIQAASTGAATVSATYTITPVANVLPTLILASGNQQTGLPGSTLAAPIVAVLRDSSGNPLAGVPTLVSASPGAVAQAAGITDQNGQAAIVFRLPLVAGVAVGSLSAGGQTVNFSALAASNSLQNFPAFTETSQSAAFVTALSALLRYYQNAGTFSAPNSLATPAALTQYLTSNNGFVLSATGNSVGNPWVAAQFAGAAAFLEAATLDRIRDLLSTGEPLVINLNLTVNGGSYGGTSVDAIGVNGDGSIAIVDPNPLLARTSLSDYLNGFTAQGNTVTGVLGSVFRAAPPQNAAGTMPFTVASVIGAGAATNSITGACSGADLTGIRFQYCDGSQPLYETDFSANTGASLVDLTGGSAATIPSGLITSWGIARKSSQLTVSPLTPSIASVTDSAAFAPVVSPGGLFTIFGSGFAGSPTVTISGKTAQVLAAFPFQINVAMPATTPVGSAVLQVSSPDGAVTANITVSAISPGIFQAGSQGAVVNADGTLNGPSNPAQRGQYVSIYCSGLGSTSLKAGLQTANTAVAVSLNGIMATPSFAGMVAGFVGLYQVNVMIPGGLAPNLAGTLAIQQGNQVSNGVPIAVD